MKKDNAIRLTRQGQWFRYWMPYCFKKLEVGRHAHVYLPLNRNYKPLGITSGEWVNYDTFLPQAVVFSADPHSFDGIWFHRETLHLYEDAVPSRMDYFARLERLLSREVKLHAKLN